jgi:hypothetical protein
MTLYKKAVTDCERALGPDHAIAVRVRNYLATAPWRSEG